MIEHYGMQFPRRQNGTIKLHTCKRVNVVDLHIQLCWVGSERLCSLQTGFWCFLLFYHATWPYERVL